MEQVAAVNESMPVTLTASVEGGGVWPYDCGGLIGGNGGTFADFYAGAPNVGPIDGRTVSKFEMWAGGWQIRGIRITLTDGTQGNFGSQEGAYNYYNFQPGELIQTLSLWGNGAGTRAGWVKFTTSMGGTFDNGMTSWGKKTQYPMNVYSGVFCGLSLRAGSDIDALGFVFFKPIDSIVISDVSYPDLATYNKMIKPNTVFTYSNTNDGEQPRDWAWTESTSKEDQQTWSFAKELKLSQSVTISAGIPTIVDVASTFTWSIGETTTQTTSSKVTTTFSVNDSGKLAKGESVNLVAIMQTGSLVNIAYSGQITFNLKSGDSYTTAYKGVFSEVAYTGLVIKDLTTDQVLEAKEVERSVRQEIM